MSSDLFDPSEGFALCGESIYQPPSMKARVAALELELANTPPPAPPVKAVFRLTAAELAKIDRNLARISQFKDSGTAAMFNQEGRA